MTHTRKGKFLTLSEVRTLLALVATVERSGEISQEVVRVTGIARFALPIFEEIRMLANLEHKDDQGTPPNRPLLAGLPRVPHHHHHHHHHCAQQVALLALVTHQATIATVPLQCTHRWERLRR